MNSRWIGYVSLALLLLTGVTLPPLLRSSGPGRFDPLVITTPPPVEAGEMVLWAAWIWPPQRRHHSPRYRLSRQQRRRLRQWQRRVAASHQPDWRGPARLLLGGLLLALLWVAVFAGLTAAGQAPAEAGLWDAPCGLVLLCCVSGSGRPSGRQAVVCTARRHYQPEFDRCLLCGAPLRSRRYLHWRKPIQMLEENVYTTSRGCYCSHHPELTYLSAVAAQLSLPHSTYGLDVVVRIGYQRDYQKMTHAQIRQSLPAHIRISERHVSNLYREYLALLACAARLDVDQLKAAAAQYGGLILAVDGLEPEGGQPQLWVAREVLTGTLLAAGWLPRVDDDTLKAFLAPVAALNLPFLATVSDKQAALIKALTALWPDLPHQYCQAHYLCNAVTPLYEADERLKVQLRQQVRAAAGVTMRQVQAAAKRHPPAAVPGQPGRDAPPALLATGLAVRPPTGLAEVKAIAQAAQEAQRRGEQITWPNEDPAPPAAPPHTVAEVRQALHGSKVLVVPCEPRRPEHPAPTTAPSTPPKRQQLVDELVVAYAARLRRVLSRRGRKPFRLAGLRLYADLLALLGSLETSLTHLPAEPRLTSFAEAVRAALLAGEADYTWIVEGYSWVLDISEILDVPLPEPEAPPPATQLSATVCTQLDAYLERLEQRTDLNAPLLAFRQRVRALTARYAPGLFHCYDIPGLPRTNNDLETLFGRVRHQTQRTSGPRHARQRLHEEGAWLLFDLVRQEQQQVRRLQRVSWEDWRQERQRLQEHRATFTADRRFRRQTPQYLAELEAQAAQIASL